ncbi:MAG: hypothetical protein R3E39_19440 [Anaerolineae bacterium]
MPQTIRQEIFTKELMDILEEVFETHHGIFLDKGTSLFETLDTISAEEASRPVSATCASIAAQVAHTTYYLEVLEKLMQWQVVSGIDWGDIWRRVEAVSADEWAAYKQELRSTYQRVKQTLETLDSWDDDRSISGALAIIVHTAYHLGEIRQAMCTVKQNT